MQEGYIHIRKNRVYFKKWGQGSKLMIAFHGFAHDHQMFNIIHKGLGAHFTTYAIDLPFHGRTKWQDKQYKPEDIGTLVGYILQQEKKEQFTALGFSYGARVWMAGLAYLPQLPVHLYLLAPDGLRTQWLGIAERTPGPFIWLIDQLSKKPDRLPRLADRLRKWHLINRFAHRFVLHHLGTYKNKRRLFQTWRSMQQFRVNKKEVKKIVAENQVLLTLIMGKRDSIVSLNAVKKLVRDIPGAQLHLLNKSHFLIDGSIARLIK